MRYCLFPAFLFYGILNASAQKNNSGDILQFIFTSDAHYGIVRTSFRGQHDVTGHDVNAAMLVKMNTLPETMFPRDSGVNAGEKTGAIDFIVEGGDIANRMEIPIQTAARSWQQFEDDYLHKSTLTDHNGNPAKLLVLPGNHDISNAIGHYKAMQPKTDATAMANIYNLMMKPKHPLTKDSYVYANDRINHSENIGGIHFMFITLWPDSAERIWMKKDLRKAGKKKPVFIFSHDQPECEAKHFSNPNPVSFNATDKFENLLAEHYKEASNATEDGGTTVLEQNGWVRFIKKHPNIKAYFHGNSNWNQFYEYKGPYQDVNLDCFRVDSPMKGKYSAKDESLLSFQVVTIDTIQHRMTVRECFWNAVPGNDAAPVKWGESKTISY